MTFSSGSYRLPWVLFVVFCLAAAGAAYAIAVGLEPAPAPARSPIATFNATARNNFTAAVQPSALFGNATHVEGGNVTLFAPITNWINATLSTTFLTNRSASVSLHERFSVLLTTPVWSKEVYATWLNTSSPSTTGLAISAGYDANVTQLLALAASIDRQLNYTSPALTLSFMPSVTGSLTVAAVRQSVAFAPDLNFSFAAPEIVPSGLAYSSSVPVYASAPLPPPTGPRLGAALVALLAGSLGAVVGTGAWMYGERGPRVRGPTATIEPPRFPTLVETGPLAFLPRTVTMRDFPDLVRVANAVGKPILRPVDPDLGGNVFLVLDGEVAYAYEHRPLPPPPPPAVAVAAEPEGGRTSEHRGIVLSQYASTLHRHLRYEARRMLRLHLDPEVLALAQDEVRRSIDALRLGADAVAAQAIEALTELLDRAEAESSETPLEEYTAREPSAIFRSRT